MKNFYKKYIEPYKDVLAYIFWGVVTTIVNLATYHLCFNILHLEYYTSSVIAWIITIIVAYLTNRKWVFHSKAKGAKEITNEAIKFTASRLATLVMEIVILYIGKDLLNIAEDPTKYIATILVIILNYVLSKFLVFTIGKKSNKKSAPAKLKKEKLNIRLSNLSSRIIIICAIIFFSILSIITILFTSALTNRYTGNLEIYLYPIPIIIGVIISIIIFASKPTKKLLSKINPKKLARFVFLWGLIVSILWIFIANVLPMWDSMDLISAANLLNGTPDTYSGAQWSDGWYLERYPYQVPIVLLITLCMKIAGSNFVILFEIINCFACAFTMYLTVKLTHELFHKNEATAISGILVMLFIPIILYCTFVYGNIICLPLALAGFLLQKRSMDASGRRAILLAILSAICLALSAYFKSSMSIVIIAAMVTWVIWGLHQKHFKFLIFALIPLIFLKTLSFATNTFVSAKTGTNLNNGVPKIAWITMGIGGGMEYRADQEADPEISNKLENPGYYDGFAWVTSKDEYSPELVAQISGQYLTKRLEHFTSDPGFALNFFTKKIITEWTEPTFEGFLASNWHVTSPTTGYNMSERDYTALAPSIYYGKAHHVLVFIMDLMQSLLVISSLITLFVLRKKPDIRQLTALLCILGGAVLYIFWENKTQYMFPFYLFMIPYSSFGLAYIGRLLHRHKKDVIMKTNEKSA